MHIWDLSQIPYLSEHEYLDFQVQPDCGDVIAVGGVLSPGMLLSAYQQGVFPWYNEGEDILWWSPKERFVLFPESLHISKSLKRSLHKEFLCSEPRFALSLDTAFDRVISACGSTFRPSAEAAEQTSAEQTSAALTWITPEMRFAYNDLHQRGYAHSVECWLQGDLVGGLYGLCLGHCFFGESMFSLVPNASKMAFAVLVLFLRQKGFRLIDCQQKSSYLGSFGAELIPREQFQLSLLRWLLDKRQDEGLVGALDSSLLGAPHGAYQGAYHGVWTELWPEFSASVAQLVQGKQVL